MNKIKETITKGDSRSFGIVIVIVAYVIIMMTMITSGATNQIQGYIQTVPIKVQDGLQEPEEYLVKQDTVNNVLDEISLTLSNKDTINKGLDETINKDDVLQITRVSNDTIVETNIVASNTVTRYDGLHLFTTEVTQQGNEGKVENTYNVTYENGLEAAKELISSNVIETAQDTITSVGAVQPGAYFTGKLTTYGGDCNGCYGYAASGVPLSPTTGVNNSNTGKLSYNGGSYYALAADPSIPFGTIIEIRNHNLSIESVAYGIVVDRGGVIKGNKIDIFKGSEKGGTTYISGGTSNNTQFKIISVGSGRNFWR